MLGYNYSHIEYYYTILYTENNILLYTDVYYSYASYVYYHTLHAAYNTVTVAF